MPTLLARPRQGESGRRLALLVWMATMSDRDDDRARWANFADAILSLVEDHAKDAVHACPATCPGIEMLIAEVKAARALIAKGTAGI